ncbi:heavy metal-associated isoprenylated plant protein 47-like [Oryza brachyantha]|uniref:HMA domain-containing protein n=1 Tax=Oryza brachyantha TaxID=4533 RepID=J3LE99_ORYBR|nr:heavy metal-associated isoprenylated plant protein 47-like [Oryza brachyantha]
MYIYIISGEATLLQIKLSCFPSFSFLLCPNTNQWPKLLVVPSSFDSVLQEAAAAAMAKKIVIKVPMASGKCRSKVMALVAATVGVVSVELAGDDKSQVVVVGDVDSVKLTSALRKKVGSAELVEVAEKKEEKKEEKKKEEEKKKDEPPAPPPVYYYYPNMYHHHHQPVYGCPCGCNRSPDSTCTIM